MLAAWRGAGLSDGRGLPAPAVRPGEPSLQERLAGNRITSVQVHGGLRANNLESVAEAVLAGADATTVAANRARSNA